MAETYDPLAEFRSIKTQTEEPSKKKASEHISPSTFRQISQSATSDQMGGDPYHYSAFGRAGQSQARLEIRKVLGATHAPGYRYLIDIVFNARQGTELVLTYTFMYVEVAGKNLQPVIAAILDDTCTFIQEYDKREFTPPLPNAPVITGIKITKREGEREEKADKKRIVTEKD